MHCIPTLDAVTGTEGVQLARLEQTGRDCPSQWRAWTADGRYLYIRYRHDSLTVEAASSEDEWWNGTTDLLLETQLNPDAWDGHLTTEEMLRTTGLVPPRN